MNITDPRFKYTHSTLTRIEETWRRFGYKPTTESERMARQKRTLGSADAPAIKPSELLSGSPPAELDIARALRPVKVRTK